MMPVEQVEFGVHRSARRCVNTPGHGTGSEVPMQDQPIPYGCCQCGCGGKTKLAPWDDRRRGVLKGEPQRYIAGHVGRIARRWEERDCGYETPCHVWLLSRNEQGYGSVRFRGKRMGAHRAAWIEASGAIPHGLFVLHKCDNPPCVNTEHLFLGTYQDNSDDKWQKGRQGDLRRRPPRSRVAAGPGIGAAVRELRQERRMTIPALHRAAGLPLRTLEKIELGQMDARLGDVAKLAAVFDMPAWELVKRASERTSARGSE